MPDASRNNKASPTEIAQALQGIDYPKSKDEIVEYARSHQQQDNPVVMSVLEHLPDREYGSMADLEKGVGQAQ